MKEIDMELDGHMHNDKGESDSSSLKVGGAESQGVGLLLVEESTLAGTNLGVVESLVQTEVGLAKIVSYTKQVEGTQSIQSSVDEGADLAQSIQQEHVQSTEGGAGLSKIKKQPTWTRLVRMDAGPVELIKDGAMSILGKRNMLAMFAAGEAEDTTSTGKRGKVGDDLQMTESAGVVVEDDGFVWHLIELYGWPEANEKRKSWTLLSHLRSFIEGPWCCIGDFNAMLHASEKQSVHAPYYNQMEDFRVALEECELADLGFSGHKFTWTNRRPGSAYTKQRLDRATANRVWMEKFPASSVSHLFSHASDHLPILLKTMKDRRVRGRGAIGFKFEENWLLWADCEESVIEAWAKGGGDSSGLRGVRDHIKTCGVELYAWSTSKTKPETEEIKRLQKKLELMNESELTEESRSELLLVSKQLDDLLLKQAIFWRQRSRVSWLNYGDRNTKFFHSKAPQRR
ncbi:hypothetical protein SO802_010408 [Lithocarpus litseifolius]|uniref:Reverse transcriptase n=1 Tax=Lithocarpus litseifolius TaxID=425828 RepID=A0AAW2DER4_9ROSI